MVRRAAVHRAIGPPAAALRTPPLGHLLSCSPRGVRASVQFIATLELGLPMSVDYLTWDSRRDTRADLDEAEK